MFICAYLDIDINIPKHSCMYAYTDTHVYTDRSMYIHMFVRVQNPNPSAYMNQM
jgi:hypothetical protein